MKRLLCLLGLCFFALGCYPSGTWEYNRGVFWLQRKQYARALEHFRKATYRNPQMSEAFFAIGVVRQKLAQQHLQKEAFHRAEGEFYASLEAFRQARVLFQKGVFPIYAKYPKKQQEVKSQVESFLGLWDRVQQQGKVPQPLLWCVIREGKVFQGAPELVAAFQLLGNTQKEWWQAWQRGGFPLSQEQLSRAEAKLKKALAKTPLLAVPRLFYGLCLFQQGRAKEALSFWKGLPQKVYLHFPKEWQTSWQQALVEAKQAAQTFEEVAASMPELHKKLLAKLEQGKAFLPELATYAQGVHFWFQADYKRAEENFQRALHQARAPESFGEAFTFSLLARFLARGERPSASEAPPKGWYFFSQERGERLWKLLFLPQLSADGLRKEGLYVPW